MTMLKLEPGFDVKISEFRQAITAHVPTRQQCVRLATFYIGVPVMFGLLAAWNGGNGLANSFSKPVSIVFWCLFYLWLWLLMALGTGMAKRMFRPWGLHDLVLILTGGLIGGILARPIYSIYQEYFYSHFLPAGTAYSAWTPLPGSLQETGYILMQAGFAALIWTASHVVWRAFGSIEQLKTAHTAPTALAVTPSYSYVPEPLPRFTRGLGITAAADILAVQAQDHYLRIITKTGDKILLYRFRDALEDLSIIKGLKVHRSYWVRLGAIAQICENNGALEIILMNGNNIPVHKKYAESLRTAMHMSRVTEGA